MKIELLEKLDKAYEKAIAECLMKELKELKFNDNNDKKIEEQLELIKTILNFAKENQWTFDMLIAIHAVELMTHAKEMNISIDQFNEICDEIKEVYAYRLNP